MIMTAGPQTDRTIHTSQLLGRVALVVVACRCRSLLSAFLPELQAKKAEKKKTDFKVFFVVVVVVVVVFLFFFFFFLHLLTQMKGGIVWTCPRPNDKRRTL